MAPPAAAFCSPSSSLRAAPGEDMALASAALAKHCAHVLAKASARAYANASVGERARVDELFGDAKSDDCFGGVRARERVCDAVFALARTRGDERDVHKRIKRENEGDGDGEMVMTSEELRWAHESARALASHLASEWTRCVDVFAAAHDESVSMSIIKEKVILALEGGAKDRARSEWRREVIVEHHRKMRASAAQSEDADASWSEAVGEGGATALAAYAEAATEVGNRAWVLSALEWVVDSVGRYFGDGSDCVAEKRLVDFSWALANKRRARAISRARGISMDEAMNEVISEGVLGTPEQKIHDVTLFDVGSCWDYFGSHFKGPWPGKLERVTTMACDLRPSTKSVFQCDWLRVDIGDRETTIEPPSIGGEFQSLVAVREHSCHALVFSLVLSYVPTAKQRGEMVRRARLTLMNRGKGLFFIITPHSTDKGHCPQKSLPILKAWRESIEALGFERVVYERHRSVHCLAFRTIGDGSEARKAIGDPPELSIAFDAQVKELKKT